MKRSKGLNFLQGKQQMDGHINNDFTEAMKMTVHDIQFKNFEQSILIDSNTLKTNIDNKISIVHEVIIEDNDCYKLPDFSTSTMPGKY